ncbi:hypothetical protein FE633_01225 [Streptomyces montanus]|uniref:Uncharacterized protein n=1 Tax=Streptomyces montanus TaxID=2580423 RepID=A0A5R9G1E2_9ACTN|nr:hypothetical protein [Streptomyces montanus]TLS48126.1 hypothetical protein FE633_01225 [Streptomyces montanus]
MRSGRGVPSRWEGRLAINWLLSKLAEYAERRNGRVGRRRRSASPTEDVGSPSAARTAAAERAADKVAP